LDSKIVFAAFHHSNVKPGCQYNESERGNPTMPALSAMSKKQQLSEFA